MTIDRRWAVLGGVAALVAGLGVTTALGNDYRFDERRVTIPVAGGRLEGVLTTPRDTAAGPAGLVVMVHGDGPVDATRDGLYAPWFEAAADAGYATLSWSKPGVGASTGSWLDQSMADRAAEVGVAIDWARTQADVPTGRVVLWGASQAGWVLPTVAAARDDVDAVVAVGTAVHWLRQAEYHLTARLDDQHTEAATREREVAEHERGVALLERGAGHAEYLAATTDPAPMDAARWAFVARNVHADATADLRAAADRDLPWLLMIGTHDRNVDVEETATTYRAALGDRLTVHRFDAAHSMARTVVEDSSAVGLVVGTVWPRALLAPGVLDAYRDALRAVP